LYTLAINKSSDLTDLDWIVFISPIHLIDITMRASFASLALVAISLVSAIPTPPTNQDQNQDQNQEQAQPPSFDRQQQVIPAEYTGGEAIYYLQNNAYGSCQEVHKDTDHVVAISYRLQGAAYPPPHCGRQIEITNVGGGKDNNDVGKKITATVVDTCTVCEQAGLELSVGAFKELKSGELDPLGNFTVDWRFI